MTHTPILTPPITIAIDGLAASGKGTLARNLAVTLNLAHMDTGSLYRLTGWRILERGEDPSDEAAAVAAARELAQNYTPDMSDIADIRSDEAGQAASKSSIFPGVRQALYDLQITFASNPHTDKNGAVLDGRDIGTVICPNANVKLFVTATTEVRAERRYKELQSRGKSVRYEAILADMHERDARDTGRALAATRPAEDAVTLNTDNLSADDALQEALKAITGKRPDVTTILPEKFIRKETF